MPYDLTLTVSPPGGTLYSLSRFRLQTDRDTTPADGAADTIDNTSLQSFSEAGMFERADGYYRFICDSDGATTPGSIYPRVELRDETEYTHDQVTEYKVAAQVISLPDGEDTIIMQILDNDNGSSSSAVKVEVKGRAPLANNAWLRFKYDPTFGGAETAFNLLDNIAVDGSGGFVIPPIRIRRGPDTLDVFFGANVDGITPNWSAGDNTPIEGNPTSAFSRTPAANFSYYWKSGNYFQNNQTSPAVQCIIDQISGTWAAPVISTGTLTVNASIASRSPLNAAPDPVQLTISSPGTDVEFWVDWYHSNPGAAYTFGVPTECLTIHRNARYGWRENPAHVYQGAYGGVIRVYGYEPSTGNSGFVDVPITVASEDSAYPGTDTIFVSPSGDFSDPRATGTEQFTGTLTAAFNAHVRNGSGAKRLMMNEGEAQDWFSIDLGAWYSNAFPSLLVTSSNPANPPTCTVSGDTQYDDRNGTVAGKFFGIAGVRLEGSYDDSTATGTSGDLPLWPLNNNLADCILMDRVTVRNCDAVLLTSDNDTPNVTITLNEVDGENTAYGTLVYRKTYNRMGCRFDSSTSAIVNSTGNQGWGERYDCPGSYAQACQSFRSQGWSPFGSQIAVQEPERLGTESYYADSVHNFVGCVLEGARGAVAIGNAQGAADVPLLVRFDQSYLIAGYQADRVVTSGAGGLKLSSTTLLQPDVQGRLFAGDDFKRFVFLDSSVGLTVANRDEPISAINCNFINRMASSRNAFGYTGQPVVFDNIDGFTDITEANNIEHHTDINTPSTPRAPLSDDTNVYSIRDTGYLSSTQDLRATTAPITTAGMSDDYEPEGGSSALNAATGTFTHFNQRGVARGASPNIGAI